MEPIEESGMSFGPFFDDKCFHIEKSAVYKSIEHGVQIAEFLLLQDQPSGDPELAVVEAKSSSPNPATLPDFDAFIEEIRSKFVNTFSLGFACILKRHDSVGTTSLPASLQVLDLSVLKVVFILVINGHDPDWLDPIHKALSSALYPTIQTWNLGPNAVKVLNDNLARERGLIA